MEKENLTKIYEILAEVADLQYAIDVGEGDMILHWQRLNVIDDRLRRLGNILSDDVFAQLPHFAKFTLTSDSINECWSDCRDEVGMAIAGISLGKSLY